MRITITAIFSLLVQISLAQELIGTYKDHFGNSIILHADSTFIWEHRFDLVYGWAVGEWEYNNGDIQLTTIPVMDTLFRKNKPDSLVISLNRTSEKISEVQFSLEHLANGGQYLDRVPNRLKVGQSKLYEYNQNGKIKTKKVKGIFTRKRLVPWFFKTD